MPNGEVNKNWIRLGIAINGFRARYGRWPERARMSGDLYQNLREEFRPQTFHVLEALLPTETVDEDAVIEVLDGDGRIFRYGENPERDTDVDAESWLGVVPDSHTEPSSQMEDLRISVRVSGFHHRGENESTQLDALIRREGMSLHLEAPTLSATSEAIPWKAIVQDILTKNPDLFGDLDAPLHRGFRVDLFVKTPRQPGARWG